MFDAIRKAWIYLLTAEMEIGFAGMSHWPFADFIGQIEQAGLIRNFRAGLCRNQTTGWSRWDRRLLISWSLSQKPRSEEHTSELQSLMRISYAVFCLKKNNKLK